MYVAEVIPLSSTMGKETLSYFTGQRFDAGSLVTVPLRKRMVPGIVVRCRPASELKSDIKSAPFEMKKLTDVSSTPFFTPNFIAAAQETARYFAGTTGSVLDCVVPQALFAESVRGAMTSAASGTSGAQNSARAKTEQDRSTSNNPERYLIQADNEERFAHYKSIIREQFARKSSLFFCLPTIQDIDAAARLLEKGIEQYTVILHSGLSAKKAAERITHALTEKHPILIIATGGYLALPRHDIGAIIVESEHSKSYKTQSRPFVDMRFLAERYARACGARLYVGDLLIRTETMFRFHEGEFVEAYPPKFRSLSRADCQLIDMRGYKGEIEREFKILSEQLEQLIITNKEQNQRLFIFTGRKGLSPTTVCGHCGGVVLCNTCGANTVLHPSPRGNFFLCHSCGERRDAMERCATCDSWKLIPLGIGLDRVADEVRAVAPHAHVYTIDKDVAKTHKAASDIVSAFYASPGSILIGTEMALPYLEQPIENTAIASLDSFFSIPDFRIHERVADILLSIRWLTESQFIVQTRRPDEAVFTHMLRGNMLDFYRQDIKERERFHYPPYSVIIKISLEGKRDAIAQEMARIQELVRPVSLDVFPSFVRGNRGASVLHGIMKIPRADWPDVELLNKLRSLNPGVVVKVDPETLL